MKMKIMLTGKNRRIADNISEHLEDDKGYAVVKCEPSIDAMEKAIQKELPHIIIICLSNETRETVKIYNSLIKPMEEDSISIVVVANAEDLRTFKDHTRIGETYYLPRPVSILELYNILIEVEEKLHLPGEEKESRPSEEERGRCGSDKEPEFIRKKILVVDDDADQLAQIKGHLTEFYDVTAVRSGPDSLKYLEKHDVDLMLLDYVMPDIDGAEVLFRIRTTRALSQLPVIFLTGMTERDVVIKTLVELRPQGYIVKPSKKSEIVAKIIDVLG